MNILINKMNIFINKMRILIYLIRNYLVRTCGKHRIFMMSTPWHGNLGDEAIILAEYQLFRELLPDYKIIEYPSVVIDWLMRHPMLSPTMQDEDILVLPGGGNLGSLYEYEEKIHRWLIEQYSEHTILFMPQSIFFAPDVKGQEALTKSKIAYDKATNLTIMERDEISYEYGKKHFQHANHLLVPDIVNVLDCQNVLASNIQRDGVCFFLRSDKEKVLDNRIIEELKDFLQQKNVDYRLTDTVISEETRSYKSRMRAVFEKLYNARRARLVITDRYHGTIFSVITHTPVLVFKSYDTKITAGVRWYRELPWVHYAEDMDTEYLKSIIEKYCCAEEIKNTKFSSCHAVIKSALAKWIREKCK